MRPLDLTAHPAFVTGPVLLVHAHPDDESIATGATLAWLAAHEVPVTLVTCTRGEQGEVIGASHAHLFGDGPALAAHREQELAVAMAAVGVRDHRFLGADAGTRFEDTGMVWGPDGRAAIPPDHSPQAFAALDVEEVAAHLVRVLEQVRPAVVIGYEPGGGYGHPDHVQAHRVMMRAVELASWAPDLVLWQVTPASVDEAGTQRVAAQGLTVRDTAHTPPSQVVPDDEVTHVLAQEAMRAAKAAAMRAHATQIVVAPDETAFALSNEIWQPLDPAEFYRAATTSGA